MKRIKNISSPAMVRCGQELVSGVYYDIQSTEIFQWANDDDVLTDLSNGVLQLNNGDADIIGVNAQIDFLKGLDVHPTDADGSELMRPKTTSPGWMQQFRCMDFTTSKWNSLVSLRPDTMQPVGDCEIKFFDSNGSQITEESGVSGAVRTEIAWEPIWDYDIAGSMVFIDREITDDVRAWAVAVPDLPPAYGGYKVNICGGMNLKFIKPGMPIRFDGRTAKRLFHSATYHTNKLKIIIIHPAGFEVGVMIMFDTYKE